MPPWLDDFLWTYQNLIYALGINGLLALSIYVVLAVGQLSLGQAAFMGLGAYSSAIMTQEAGSTSRNGSLNFSVMIAEE